MLVVYSVIIICQFFLSGMLTSAILTNKAEGKPNKWNLYIFAVLCFLFGIYHLITLIGYGANQCSGS